MTDRLYYYWDGEKPIGPTNYTQLENILAKEILPPETLVCEAGSSHWIPFATVQIAQQKLWSKAHESIPFSCFVCQERREIKWSHSSVIPNGIYCTECSSLIPSPYPYSQEIETVRDWGLANPFERSGDWGSAYNSHVLKTSIESSENSIYRTTRDYANKLKSIPRGKNFTLPLINLEMIWCGAYNGRSQRGDGFWIAKTTLTRGQAYAINNLQRLELAEEPCTPITRIVRRMINKQPEKRYAYHPPPNLPDEPIFVNYSNAWHYCKAIAIFLLPSQGRPICRLPSTVEWEYACVSGDNTLRFGFNGSTELSDYAWFKDNSEGTVHPVGQKRPNKWGICDMHGNVSEWTGNLIKKNMGGYDRYTYLAKGGDILSPMNGCEVSHTVVVEKEELLGLRLVVGR